MAALISVSKPPGSTGYTCKVPLDLLSQDGVPPEQGDSVSYSVDGTVESVDAEDATVKITSVNGEPVDESAAAEGTEDQGAPPPPGGPPVAGGGGPSTAAMGAALRAGAKGRPMPF